MIPNQISEMTVVGVKADDEAYSTITNDAAQLAMIQTILVKKTYKDPIGAPVRELLTNADDAHIESGSTRPIQITTANRIEPHYSIRDFGTGIEHDRCLQINRTIGLTTKAESNAVNGCMGIGSRSPFAYGPNPSYVVTSRHKGKKAQYLATMSNGLQRFDVIAEPADTDELDGYEVSFAIQGGDAQKFKVRADHYSRYLQTPVEIDGVLVTEREPLVKSYYRWSNANRPFHKVELGDGYEVSYFSNDNLRRVVGSRIQIVMGSVPYSLDYDSVPDNLQHPLFEKFVFDIKVKMGDIQFNASREDVFIDNVELYGGKSPYDGISDEEWCSAGNVVRLVYGLGERMAKVVADRVAKKFEKTATDKSMSVWDRLLKIQSSLKGLDYIERRCTTLKSIPVDGHVINMMERVRTDKFLVESAKLYRLSTSSSGSVLKDGCTEVVRNNIRRIYFYMSTSSINKKMKWHLHQAGIAMRERYSDGPSPMSIRVEALADISTIRKALVESDILCETFILDDIKLPKPTSSTSGNGSKRSGPTRTMCGRVSLYRASRGRDLNWCLTDESIRLKDPVKRYYIPFHNTGIDLKHAEHTTLTSTYVGNDGSRKVEAVNVMGARVLCSALRAGFIPDAPVYTIRRRAIDRVKNLDHWHPVGKEAVLYIWNLIQYVGTPLTSTHDFAPYRRKVRPDGTIADAPVAGKLRHFDPNSALRLYVENLIKNIESVHGLEGFRRYEEKVNTLGMTERQKYLKRYGVFGLVSVLGLNTPFPDSDYHLDDLTALIKSVDVFRMAGFKKVSQILRTDERAEIAARFCPALPTTPIL